MADYLKGREMRTVVKGKVYLSLDGETNGSNRKEG